MKLSKILKKGQIYLLYYTFGIKKPNILGICNSMFNSKKYEKIIITDLSNDTNSNIIAYTEDISNYRKKILIFDCLDNFMIFKDFVNYEKNIVIVLFTLNFNEDNYYNFLNIFNQHQKLTFEIGNSSIFNKDLIFDLSDSEKIDYLVSFIKNENILPNKITQTLLNNIVLNPQKNHLILTDQNFEFLEDFNNVVITNSTQFEIREFDYFHNLLDSNLVMNILDKISNPNREIKIINYLFQIKDLFPNHSYVQQLLNIANDHAIHSKHIYYENSNFQVQIPNSS